MSVHKISDNGFIFEKSNAVFLRNLVENGQASILEDGSVEVLFDSVYELTDFEREVVGLPPLYPFEIMVSHEGLLTTASFCYVVTYYTFAPLGDILPRVAQYGPVITLKVNGLETDYLLSRDQFRLVSALSEYNELPSSAKNRIENLKRFAEIKDLSKDAATVLDETLSDRHVVLPKNVKLDIKYENGELNITPTIESPVNDDFVAKFDQKKDVPDHYPIQKGSLKTFVVIDPPIQEELEKVKENRKITDPEQIKKIVERPEEFFDPEVTDLSVFYSDRVIGKGLYEPKVYPFISPYKSQWIPSFEVVDRTNGTTKIYIANSEQLAEFREVIDAAKKDEKPFCEYRGANIPIEKAEEMLAYAKERLHKKESVADSGEPPVSEEKKKPEVLLIEENMEDLGYDLARNLDQLPKQLSLSEDPFLNENFSLKDHQTEGIAWLQSLSSGQKGGLLADDMGLGKTLQVLYLLDWHSRQQKEDKPYLIIAPVSLLENWVNEYERFFRDGMLIEIVERIPKEENQDFIRAHSYKHIMVVGYEAMRRGQFSMAAIDFSIIVLDEAQKIKAPGTMVTNAAKALKSDLRISMTGTPVENTYMDLWCIMDFAVPGLLGNAKEFAHQFQDPLSDEDVNIEELGNKLRSRLGTHFLRRLKADISKDLPNKSIEYHKVPMPQEQIDRYVSAVNMGQESGAHPFERIQLLRKVSDHPYLDFLDVERMSIGKLISSSAKLSATMQILNEIKAKDEKVIIFTDRRDMQRMLQRILLEMYGLEVSVINGDASTVNKGKTPSRQKTVDQFQEKNGFNIIIMSPLAAGVGLNVVGANHVIHYSRHWNPAKENQATDRVYRIGQTKDVFVHIPMAVCPEGFAEPFDSFDLVLDQLLQNKTHLASASLYPTERIEVIQKELDGRLFGKKYASSKKLISEEDVSLMDEYLFEAFAAVFYSQNGYKTQVTPRNGDKGVDVVAFGSNDNLAIQCKHSKSNVGVEAVNEVVAGAAFYAKKYGKVFKPVVFTNSTLTTAAKELASANGVSVVEGKNILVAMKGKSFTWDEIQEVDSCRG